MGVSPEHSVARVPRGQSVLPLLLACMMNLAWGGGDPVAGQQKAAPCGACHQAQGNSVVPEWPKLAGQHAHYLVNQMMAYQRGEEGGRYDEVMTPLMATLSEQDIADIAAYYAEQSVTLGVVDAKWLDRGQRLYRGGDASKGISACIACHGPNGLGNPEAGFPQLSGQHPAYTIGELQQYKAGTRSNDINGMMRDIATRMDEDDIQAVANYIYGLY